MIARLAREPLVHFIAIGALFFAGWFWLHPPEQPADEIVIDQREFDHLKTMWKAQWKRDPAPSDVQAIIDRHVREEVFYREGLRLKLDRNDEIVKRRISQKMEAVAGDLGNLMKPVTEDDLRKYLRDHADLFSIPQSYAFRQVLFQPSERQQADSVLAALRKGAAVPESRKERLGVPNDWADTTVPELANAFGDEFLAALAELPQGQWSGPIQSGYGLHLVYLERSVAPTLPDFESVEPYVRREYEYQAQLAAEEELFKTLRERYSIRVTAKDVPDPVLASLALQ